MIPIRPIRRAWLGIVLLAVASCDSTLPLSPLSEQRRAAVARKRWISQAPSSYSFIMGLECFCVETREMRVTVVNGVVVSVRPLDTDEELAGPARASFRPIVDLFSVVLDAISRLAYSIRAEYDPALGFPSSVFIDYERNIADEEYGFRVRDVVFP